MKHIELLLKDENINITTFSKLFSTKLNLNYKLLKKVNTLKAKDLTLIHKDTLKAKELIILFLTNFNKSYYKSLTSDDEYIKDGFVNLNAETLRENIHLNYNLIIDLLIEKGLIIKGRNYIKNKRSNEYRLNKNYFNLKFSEYEPKTNLVKRKVNKTQMNSLIIAMNNPIAKNELEMISKISLPKRSRIKKVLLEAVKNGYKNKKGKPLKALNKKKRENDKYVYVEDYLDIFDYLTNDFIIPHPSYNAGGRVYTSFNLLPSIIKKELGLVEVDFSCLHPNLANKKYGGSGKLINHQIVADYLNIDLSIAKKEHLSFFNKDFNGMLNSPLFEYYIRNEKEMMGNIIKNKKNNDYKNTSKELFEFETLIMSEILMKLRINKIYPLYNFDAFLVEPKDTELTIRIMNDTIKKYGINTIAKI